MVSDKKSGSERRQFIRIRKNYIVRFCQKNNPSLKFEVSQVENISRGGICFTSTMAFEPGSVVALELRTPYVADTICLEGQILDSHEKIKGLIYQNRLKFYNITHEASDVLEKIEKYNLNKVDYR